MAQEIPLQSGASNANVTFSSVLDGINYTFHVAYRPITQYYMLSIERDNVMLASGLKMVAGGNLMASYTSEFIKQRNQGDLFGELYVVGQRPTVDNFGITNRLLWEPASE